MTMSSSGDVEIPRVPVIEPRVRNDYHFGQQVDAIGLDLSPLNIATLQINVGKICNQACRHCHVDASPTRTETMDRATAERVIEVLAAHDQIGILDITGGAPELNDHFRFLIEEGRRLGRHVMVRHNITVQIDGHPRTGASCAWLPEYFAANGVEVVCSLPYYGQFFTDRQRGKGVFEKSIEGLKRLNDMGYGREGSGLVLNLVYNPVGAFLPAPQESLEADYRRELSARFEIVFNSLYTITNMPIHRFREDLQRHGGFEEYMTKLVNAFNPSAAEGVMCRTMISVDYDGRLSDCDFNQMLDISLEDSVPRTIFDFDLEAILSRRIVFADHCFGCTAGAGSSCGGVIA